MLRSFLCSSPCSHFVTEAFFDDVCGTANTPGTFSPRLPNQKCRGDAGIRVYVYCEVLASEYQFINNDSNIDEY